jgi:hypothetical protein
MAFSTSKYGHGKYTISAADLIAQGAATTFDFPLESLPPGTVVYSYLLKANTAVAGAGTAVARPKLNAVAIGAGTTNVAVTTGAIDNTIATGSLAAANPLVLTVTTGTAMSGTTAGSIDLILNYAVLGP